MDTIVLQIKYAESQYDLCYEMCYLEEYAQCLRNDTGDKMFNEAGHDSGKLTQLARNAWRAVLNLLSRILEKIADWMRWGAKKTQNRGPEIVEIPEVYASKKNRGKLKQIVAQIKKVVSVASGIIYSQEGNYGSVNRNDNRHGNFNTSHVSINQWGAEPGKEYYTYFNTSHVSINQDNR